MKNPRYSVVAAQLKTIQESFDTESVSEALSRIAFAALPDWGDFEVPDWLVEGLRPLFSSLPELCDSLKVDLLECLAHLYDCPLGPRPDLELDELKANLSELPVPALPFALSIIAQDGKDARRYLEDYINHEHDDVRAEALAGLEKIAV